MNTKLSSLLLGRPVQNKFQFTKYGAINFILLFVCVGAINVLLPLVLIRCKLSCIWLYVELLLYQEIL